MERVINRDNYILTQTFLGNLSEKVSQKSSERYRFYLRHLLLWSMDTHLSKAHKIAPSFSAYVAGLASPRGGCQAEETQKKIFNLARQFFEWAKMEYPTEFKSLNTSWIQKLQPPRQSSNQQPKKPIDLELLQSDLDDVDTDLDFVSLEDACMLANLPKPDGDLAHWRDCAMASFLYLSGARAKAATTIPIGAVHFDKMTIRQWPKLGVETKNGKTATTYLHDIPELIEVAQSWDAYVRTKLPITAPWYAPVNSQWGEQQLSTETPGANRSVGLNKRLRLLFSQAGLAYQSAHKFRHGHAVYGLQHCETMADYKALSENMMHENLEITDGLYVHIHNQEIRARILGLAQKAKFDKDAGFMNNLRNLPKEDKLEVINFLAKELAK